jgi:CubicO group peptidase (beta-lactamase class C family)
MSVPIHGTCDPDFAGLERTFVENFERNGELGARVAVIREGRTVVDLWGGYTTTDRTEEWRDNSLVCCHSVTKGIVALAAHLLASRGLLDYEAPVARYWPEFSANGKTSITVRQALGHRTSLAFIDAAVPGDILDWDVFVAKIAAQEPNWPVGTDETYHSVTFGFIVGEIVRRIDGRSIDRFITEELASPCEAEFILGCSDDDLRRVVAHIPNPANDLMNGGLINEQTLRMFACMPDSPEFLGSDASLQYVFPSGNGVSHALAIARLFSPFANGGRLGTSTLFLPEIVAKASEEQWHHRDSVFDNDFRVALGLLLHIPFNWWGREGNVGTAGAGGFCAFADPVNRISFGYTPNRYTTGAGMGEEPRRLIDALYASL